MDTYNFDDADDIEITEQHRHREYRSFRGTCLFASGERQRRGRASLHKFTSPAYSLQLGHMAVEGNFLEQPKSLCRSFKRF
jgi:hypothetical protein